MATNRFVCEVCNKGFQREQNLQLHRRGHNLPWNLKQKNNGGSKELIRKKVYLCPEPTCVHHDPTRALGDLTGIKKHYSRKHGEKKYRCEKCSKKYAVQSDWKAHSKTCGTREYRCDCGTIFSRRDSFITHRAFCNALAEESARNLSHPQLHFSGSGSGSENGNRIGNTIANHHHLHLIGGQNHQNLSLPNHDFFRYAGGSHFDNLIGSLPSAFCIPSRPPFMHQQQQLPQLHGAGSSSGPLNLGFFPIDGGGGDYPSLFTYGGNYGSFMHIPDIPNPAYMSATALLQKSGIYASMTGETDSSSQLGFEKPEEYHNLSSIGLPFVPGLYNHHHHQDVDEYAGFCGESKVENSSNLHGIMEFGEDGKLTRDFLGVGEIMGVHQHQRKRINTMENHIKPTPQGDPFN